MNLYEHQSTWNPNMPLRGLLYFAELYERYINSHGYRLSEAFESQREGIKPALDCQAVILNINSGHNRELMEKCQRLQEYAEFIQEIRKNLQKGMTLEKALGQAIEYCLKHGILADILQRSQAEVRSMLLEEYDEKAEREYLRNEAITMGLVEEGLLSLEQAKERVKEKEEFVYWYQERKKI